MNATKQGRRTWELGRGEEPLGFEAGDANLYRYCDNDPTDAMDPSGLAPQYPPSWPLPQTDAIEGQDMDIHGWFCWKVSPRPGGVKANFGFLAPNNSPFYPDMQVVFVQVVQKSVLREGGKDVPFYPGNKAYFQQFSTDPSKANFADHLQGRDTLYYNATWGSPNWYSSSRWMPRGGQTIGNFQGANATMRDFPGWTAAHKRDLLGGEVLHMEFETAVFCINSQTVFGVIKWGFEVSDNDFDKPKLLPVEFCHVPSPEFTKLVEKANSVGAIKHKIGPPVHGMEHIGGFSALPE